MGALTQVISANAQSGHTFWILSNPEFLAEGTAMRDLDAPDRVLIGGPTSADGLAAAGVLADIYANWVPRERILTTNLWSSELSKLVPTRELDRSSWVPLSALAALASRRISLTSSTSVSPRVCTRWPSIGKWLLT